MLTTVAGSNASARRSSTRELKNPYFMYSLCTTLALLLTAVVCAKLWIDHRRAMWITAEMMADIYNQDAYSRRIAQEAIEKYNTHIERCNRAIEAAEHGEAVSTTGSEIEQLRGELACVAERAGHGDKRERPCTRRVAEEVGDHGRDVHSPGGVDEQVRRDRCREAIV